MGLLKHYFGDDGPGAALALATDGRSPLVECVGFADLERRTPITAATMFELASASKTFTAAAVMVLVERRALELTAPLHNLLPACPPPSHGRAIAVRDLLQHTSGLEDYLAEVLSNEFMAPVERISQRAIRAGRKRV